MLNKCLPLHTCFVLTVIAGDRGPSPAGLNANTCIRYSVYLSRKTKL